MNDRMIYVHFPFCKRKCSYCDFYSISDISLKDAYISRICEDIASAGRIFPDTKIKSVYIGGGTPSVMSAENIDFLFKAIRNSFSLNSDAEITCEVNPESTSMILLDSLKRNGVNRISMGVQSADDTELSEIGRIHDFKTVSEAVGMINEIGFYNFSLDLIYGLPSQTKEIFRKNLEKIISLSPKHVSFYALSLSENVPLYKRINEIPDDETEREMYLDTVSFLEKNGYLQYEISNAALPGFESKHNSGYWDGTEYFGFGASAHSFLNNSRFSVLSDVKKFISEDNRESLIRNVEKRTLDDEYTEFIFLSLRTNMGLDLDLTEEKFGLEKRMICENVLFELTKHDLTKKTGSGYRLTPKGFFVSDAVITKLL